MHLQLHLAGTSKEYLTIQFLYQFNRLSFGVALAPAIFLCYMETLFCMIVLCVRIFG